MRIDHRSGSEVGPGEFLGTCPAERHRLTGSAGQPCGLHGKFAGMFAPECRTKVRNNDSDLILRHMKRIRQLLANAKRVLRASPDRQPASLPLRNSRSWFQGCVLDVWHMIGTTESFCAVNLGSKGILRHTAFCILAQIAEQFETGRLRRILPFRGAGNRADRTLRTQGVWSSDANKIAIVHHNNPRHRLRGRKINR